MPRQCQSVRLVKKLLSVAASQRWRTTAPGTYQRSQPRLRRAVAEVDLLAVHAKALVEAAELVEHRAAEEQAAAEHPVGLDGLGGTLVEEVVVALVLERRAQATQRRAPDERAAHGREAAPRRLPGAVRIDQLRPRHAAAGVRLA